MRLIDWRGVLAAAGLVLAGTAPASSPMVERQLAEAHRLADDGSVYVMIVSARDQPAAAEPGVYVFYNNPEPFCFTYWIPGNWQATGTGDYRSPDGRAGVDVTFVRVADLPAIDGKTPIERLSAMLARDHSSAVGKRMPPPTLTPLADARPGTWRWAIPPLRRNGRQFDFPPEVLADLGPEAVARIVVVGTADDEGLARRILASLQTTRDPACYWQVLERMLTVAFPP